MTGDPCGSWSHYGRGERAGTGSIEIERDWQLGYRRSRRPTCALVSVPLFTVGAEGVGFEPTETRNASPVFKTGAIGH